MLKHWSSKQSGECKSAMLIIAFESIVRYSCDLNSQTKSCSLFFFCYSKTIIIEIDSGTGAEVDK